MYKKIIIIGLAVSLLFLGLTLYRRSGTIEIPGKDGAEVRVDDIYKKAEVMLPADNLGLKRGDGYLIDYYPKYQQFSISLSGSDLARARNEAESVLLAILGIDQAKACELNVSLTVPYSVKAEAAGIEFGLSFCPGAVALPQ